MTRRRGTSLIEVVISMIVISVMLVAALRTVGATARTESRVVEEAAGRELVEGLLAEIRAVAYEDPDGSPVFGPEPDEAPDDRALWDDVDDFHGWKASPPVDRGGVAISGAGDWSRSVTVTWADPADPTLVEVTESGLKRVEVTAWRGERPVARARAFVAAGGARTAPDPWSHEGPGPRAVIAPIAVRGIAPLTLDLDGSGSMDPRGEGLTWRWTFGDGATAAGTTVSHTYLAAGTYTLTLEVRDGLGRRATSSLIVAVEDSE